MLTVKLQLMKRLITDFILKIFFIQNGAYQYRCMSLDFYNYASFQFEIIDMWSSNMSVILI